MECDDFERPDPATYPEGAALLFEGRIQASRRDWTFVVSRWPRDNEPRAVHAVTMTSRYAVGGGMVTLAAACDPVRIALLAEYVKDATDFHPNARCQRSGCRQLFAQAATDELTKDEN
ncbi:hypothetical protein A6A07_07105 [Streptomyces sp. CB03911]|nr:hypothetical protein A6A07_07105 [Streptomyces sp. CB03911]